MTLVEARVQNFRSLDDSGPVAIDPRVTVLVGQNESGKTAFLNALHLCRPAQKAGGFQIDRDYPRQGVHEYRRRHDAKPADAVRLSYRLTPAELAAVNDYLGMPLLAELPFTTTHHYRNNFSVGIAIDEVPYLRHLVDRSKLPAELKENCKSVSGLRALLALLAGRDLNADGQEFRRGLVERFRPEAHDWPKLIEHEVWAKFLSGWLPKFFYFDEYDLLPGRVNLKALAARAADPARLTPEDCTALSLLRLADVDLAELAAARGYEETKSRLESLSASITDAVLKYWARDHGLEVEFDVRADPSLGEDGPNLYVRVKDKRHRVSLPLGQRSKGFVWFFSFVVRFETIQRQAGPGEGLILLLDEPGLNLHALAQIDFLRYIEALSGAHQVVYTTHSPFMIPGDRLDRVRLVEDRPGAGTVVTTDLAACDARTVFPLQAALGTAIARAVLPARRNLLVEGLADVVTLKVLSAALEKAGRAGLRGDVAVVPMGGLKRLATFLALLGPGELELVVLSGEPLAGGPDGGSARELLARQRRITGYGRYRTLAKGKVAPEPPPESAGVEDLFTPAFYLKQVSAAYAKALGNKEVKEADLPAGERLVARLASHLAERGTPFTRDAVADHLALNPPRAIDKETLARFEELFKDLNKLFGHD